MKKYTALFAALTLVLALAGCGAETQTPMPGQSEQEEFTQNSTENVNETDGMTLLDSVFDTLSEGTDVTITLEQEGVRQYYPHIAELSEDEVAKQAPFGAKWRLLAQVEVRCYILISNISGSVKVAPLQILQFPVILPHKFQDAEKFNLQFSDFSEITETADKLRWLRYQKGLRQRDVADYAGIYRSTYIHYEEYGKDFYSPKHMEKIAQLFEVPVERLLDDYNLFLRNGQGKQIKAIRMKLGLTQREYADRLGISLCNLKQWEQNRKQLFKSTWEKYFK